MKVYHRLLGDPPSVGFGFNISTPGFPVGIKWMDLMDRVRLGQSTFFNRAESDGLQVLDSAYEYQSLDYGHITAIRSVSAIRIVNGVPSGRPHAYTHAAAFQLNGLVSDEWTPAQLMTFDEFVAPEEFWRVDKNVKSMPLTEWTPPPAVPPAKPKLDGELQLALLARYWKAASQRAFDSDPSQVRPVLMCLGDETDGLPARAKAFLANEIAALLPVPVQNILSMSVGVYLASAAIYQPTAMLVLYPETFAREDEMLFDLRSGIFVPVNPNEKAFIASVLRGETSPLLQKICQVYSKAKGGVSPSHCQPMADYFIAYNAFYLENELYGTNTDAALSHWRALVLSLINNHGLALDAVAELAGDSERRLLSKLTQSPLAQEISEDNFYFLYLRCMSAPDDITLLETKLLTEHQAMRQKPFFADHMAPFDHNDSRAVDRAAYVLHAILTGAYLDDPLDEQQRDRLSSKSFVELCRRHPSFQSAMVDYLQKAGQRHPENGLFMLPLMSLFLDGSELLDQSLRLLRQSYVSPLPNGEICASVSKSIHALPRLTDSNKELLTSYYEALFERYRDNAEVFANVISGIGADTTAALCQIFSSYAEKADQPLPPDQWQRLCSAMLPWAENPAEVARAYEAMVKAVSARAVEQGVDRLEWLCGADRVGTDGKPLIPPEAAQVREFRFFCDLAHSSGNVPSDRNFQRLLTLLQGTAARDESLRNDLKQTYEQFGEAAEAQAEQLLPYFTSVADTSYLKQLWLRQVRARLRDDWAKTGRYWECVDALNDELKRGNASRDELCETMESDCQAMLLSQSGSLATPEAFVQAINRGKHKPNDGFARQWDIALKGLYGKSYGAFFNSSGSWEDIRELDAIAINLHVTPDGRIGDAKNALNGIMGFLDKAPTLPTEEGLRLASACIAALSNVNDQQTVDVIARVVSRALQIVLPRCDFSRKLPPVLLAAYIRSNAFNANVALQKLFVWGDGEVNKPYSHLAQLQNLVWLLRKLEEQRPADASTLCNTLLTVEPYKTYSAKVRGDRANREKYFPWTRKNGMLFQAKPPESLEHWLTNQTLPIRLPDERMMFSGTQKRT